MTKFSASRIAAHGVVQAGVIGTGTMGLGIAQVLAEAGVPVLLYDQNPGAVERAVATIGESLARQVSKGHKTEEAHMACMQRLHHAADLNALASCDLVAEAIVEDLAAKQTLFHALEKVLRQDAILTTNTSSLSVTAVASACSRPERVVGWHFFNPVPLMRIAEVVQGERTAVSVADRVAQLTGAIGHRAVHANDMPGFVVNHAGRAFIPEGLRLLSEGIADAAQIDQIMRDTAGFRMGPFELLDLVGLDVALQVMDSLYHQYYEEPRFRITPLVARKVAAGQLGRKRSEGFYSYVDGKIQIPDEPILPRSVPAGIPVWIAPYEKDLADRIRERLAGHPDVVWETGEIPSQEALILVTPVGDDVATTCHQHGLTPARVVAVDALFPLEKRVVLMAAPGLLATYRDMATALLQSGGAAVTWLRDSPGFVAQRIVAQIINIGADMAQHRVASPADIDAAVTLALGYPQGPFALAAVIGERRVLQISKALHAAYGDPRYRPSIWLRRRAQLDQPLGTLD